MPETGLVEYNITDAVIAEMKSIYMELTITDLDDKEQFDAVHSARMVVKGKRVEVEKRRKELKADALAFGREVDGKAKKIFEKLEPIETHLDREEKKVTDEEKRVKAESDRKEKEKIEKRINTLAAWGQAFPFFEIAGWDDAKYDEVLLAAMEKYEDEKNRLAEEETARKAEAERLEKVRKEQEVEAARLAEEKRKQDEVNWIEREKIEAERREVEAYKQAIEAEKRNEQERKNREAFEAQAKEDARIAAEKAATEKAEREAREAEEKAEKEAAKLARKEALMPDKEKLIAWVNKIKSVVATSPAVTDEWSQGVVVWVETEIEEITGKALNKIEEL